MSEAIFEQVEEQPKFFVDNDQKAEWCLQKIREAQADKDRWKAFYAEQYKAVEESADATIHNMEEMLAEYFGMVPHKQTATQEYYKLPSGKLVLKKQEPKYERNDDEIIDWLKKNDCRGFIKVEESLDWAGLKKKVAVVGENMATEDGEIIPGIKVIQREPIFKVEDK